MGTARQTCRLPPRVVRVIKPLSRSFSPACSIQASIVPEMMPPVIWIARPTMNQLVSPLACQESVTAQSEAASMLGSTSDASRLTNAGSSMPRNLRARSCSMHARQRAQRGADLRFTATVPAVAFVGDEAAVLVAPQPSQTVGLGTLSRRPRTGGLTSAVSLRAVARRAAPTSLARSDVSSVSSGDSAPRCFIGTWRCFTGAGTTSLLPGLVSYLLDSHDKSAMRRELVGVGRARRPPATPRQTVPSAAHLT